MHYSRLLSAVALLCMSGSAVAVDWAGFYVGINQADQTVEANWTTTEVRTAFGGGEVDPVSDTQASFETDESATGLRIGHNWILSESWVVGVEAVTGAVEHEHTIDHIPGLDFDVNESFVDIDAESDEVNLRVRGGYLVMPELLLFLTAGSSKLDVEVTTTCPSDGGACSPFEDTQSKTNSQSLSATVIGLGAEYAINRFLIHLEMVKADFGDFSFTALDDETVISFGADATVGIETETLQLGVSYDF